MLDRVGERTIVGSAPIHQANLGQVLMVRVDLDLELRHAPSWPRSGLPLSDRRTVLVPKWSPPKPGPDPHVTEDPAPDLV
ncbi:hypothetical protein GCM10027087_39040 [Paractinoplanes abujensis]